MGQVGSAGDNAAMESFILSEIRETLALLLDASDTDALGFYAGRAT